MTSTELISLRKQYVTFKEHLERLVEYGNEASDNITGCDVLMRDYFAINDNPVDEGYLKEAIIELNTANKDIVNALSVVTNKIYKLDRKIEIQKDKELAESLSIASKMTPGSL